MSDTVDDECDAFILDMLPAEVLSVCLTFLPTSKDVHEARLVCKAFHLAANPRFGASFNDKFFHVSGDSLTKLSRLTARPELAPYVKVLWFKSCEVDDRENNFLDYPSFHPLLALLSNLTEIRVINEPWRPNSEEATIRSVWVSLANLDSNGAPALRAITTSGNFNVANLPSPINNFGSLIDQQPKTPALHNITKFNIALCQNRPYSMFDVENLPALLSSLPSLHEFSVVFPIPSYAPFVELYGDAGFEALLRGPRLSHLKKLSIKNVYIRGQPCLKRWLKGHTDTLRELQIINLGMCGFQWKDFVHFLSSKMKLKVYKMTMDADLVYGKMVDPEEAPTDEEWMTVAESVMLDDD